MTWVAGEEVARVELLEQFQMFPQGEKPSLCFEVWYRGVFVASDRDPQGLVQDHQVFQDEWRSEPDVRGIVKDWAYDGLVCLHQSLRRKPQLDPAKSFMTLRALDALSSLDTVACVRAKGEVGVQLVKFG